MKPLCSAVIRLRLVALVLLLSTALPVFAQRQMEKLGRGVIVVRTGTSSAYIGWRLLATDPDNVGFNLLRSANGVTNQVNSLLITNTTDYTDTGANFNYTNAWFVQPVAGGVTNALSAPWLLPSNAPTRQYFSVPLAAVTNGAAPPYDVKFCWVGDLDGDGEYDFVVDRLSTSVATNQFLQAYKRDGTFLWQMDMGYNSTNQYNIEPGSSAISIGDKDNVTVYDFDGDGYAEVAVRTARGVILPDGTAIAGSDDTTQYLSILNGLTGKEMARMTLTNLWPSDGPMSFRFGVMYCDGVHPSLVMEGENRNAAGNFQRESMAFDYRNGQLTRRWFFTPSSTNNLSWSHQIRISDVNHDGIDELLDIGSAKSGKDGQPIYDTELLHGDRFHIMDIDPDHPGLETFAIQQNNPTLLATALFESGTGKMMKKWYSSGVVDVSRGVALDMDPDVRGCEFYSTQPGIFDCKGNVIFANSIWPPEGVWWDADLSRELEDGAGNGALSPVINKFDPGSGTAGRLYSIYSDGGGYQVHQAYGGRAAFWGDILGDWREELVLVANDYSEIRIYTTKLAATNRLYCLMQNPQYRDQATCKGYYQASYVDYYLGNGMPPPPPPPVSNAKLVWRGDGANNVWDAAATANWFTNWFYVGNANTNPAPFNPGDTVLFDLTGSNNAAITLAGSLAPGDVRVHSPKDYTFGGSGSLDGTMGLTKAGAGKLTFNGTNTYSGKTLIAEGQLVVNGSLPNSPVTVRGGVWLDSRLGGTGVVGSAVSINEGAGLSPGQGTNSTGTLTLTTNLSLNGRTLNDFDLSGDPTGTTNANDLLVVNGNLILKGTNTFVIHLLNTGLAAGGVYPLITYAGTLAGGLTNFAVSGLSGIPYALTNPPGQIALLVKGYRSPATITWAGGSGGNAWDLITTPNWLNGAAKDMFAPYDAVRFDNTGASNLTVNLVGDLNAASVVVDSASNYLFSGGGGIIGACSLTKTNSGTLAISNANSTYSGKTTVAGGTLVVSELDAIGFASPIGNPPGGSTNLILSGNAVLRITGESYTDRGMTLNAGTNAIDVYNSADQVTIAGQIVGSGALVKAGAGTLALTVANAYTGGTFICGGTVALGSTAGNQSGLGTGLVTISNATLSLMDVEASENIAWNMNVPANSVNYLNCDGRSTMSGSLIGGGTLNVYSPYVRTDFSGNWSAFTGQFNATGGNFRENNSAGYPNAKFYIGSASLQNRVGGTPTVSIGELSGAQGGNCYGGTGNDGLAVNWSVGGLNTSATFACSTYNNIGFIKVGTGTWTWTGTNIAHTGQTTVNGGTLLYNGNGSNSTSTVTIGASGTLGGTGTIGGATTVNGRLSPGSNTIGTLTFLGNVTLGTGSATFIEINKNTGTRDLVDGNATVTYGGTLQVTNLAGTLAANDSFKIFDAATYAGSFGTFVLPALGAGLSWNTAALNTGGTLSIIASSNAVPPAAPGGLTATAVSYSQINLTWTDNSTNETGFLIERSLDNTNFTQIASVGLGVTNYSDTGLAGSTTYYYRVRASGSTSNSTYSNVASAATLNAPAALVWRGDGVGNVWDVSTTANWRSNGIASVFTDGAAALFDDSGSNNVAVSLSGLISPSLVTVSASKNYTFSGGGSLSNSMPLIKTGSGTLTISSAQAYSGGTFVGAGTFALTTSGSAGSGSITFSNSTAFTMSGSSVFINPPVSVAAGATVTMNSGNLANGYSGSISSEDNQATFIIAGPVSLSAQSLKQFQGFTGTVQINSGAQVRYSASKNVVNGGDFAQFVVNGTLNTRNGGSVACGSLAGTGWVGGAGNADGNTAFTIGALGVDSTFYGTLSDATSARAISLTKVGAGTLTLAGGNTYSLTTTISAGTLQIGDGGATGTLPTNNIVNNATLAFNRADAISDRGTISGTGSLRQLGDGVLTFTNVHTYTGPTTIESGTLALAGGGSIANSTNINIFLDALFDVSGRTGGGMTLASGKTLSGNGSVKGDFTVGAGAKLSPGIGNGSQAFGTMAFSNTLSLSAGSTNIFEISAPFASDRVSVQGSLNRGGTLVVTNIGANLLAAGNNFQLFNATAITPSPFNSLVLPPLGTNLVWDTNSFVATGTLTVISTAPLAFNSVVSLGDGGFRLTFSGPTGRDYELRATTNLMLAPVTLWDLVDSGTLGNDPVTFDDLSATNNPQKFYRLLLP